MSGTHDKTVAFTQLVGTTPFLVLAPHPDDESLGCGGLLCEAASRRHPACIAWLTDGARSHPGSSEWPPARLAARRRAEANAAAAVLGVAEECRIFLDAPDGAAPHAGPGFDLLAAQLGEVVTRHGIGGIFATWMGDPHGDHGAAAKLAAAVCAARGIRHMAYPIWAWTVPDAVRPPALLLDIRAHRAQKARAIAAHSSQLPGGIPDDADGFAMTADFLRHFAGDVETFYPM